MEISIKSLCRTEQIKLNGECNIIRLKKQIKNIDDATNEEKILVLEDQPLDNDGKLLTKYVIGSNSEIVLRFNYEKPSFSNSVGTSEDQTSQNSSQLYFCTVCKKGPLGSIDSFNDHKKCKSHKDKVNEQFNDSLEKILQPNNNLEKRILFNFIRKCEEDCLYRREILKDYFIVWDEILLIYLRCFQGSQMSISLNCTYSDCGGKRKDFTITHEARDKLDNIFTHLETNMNNFEAVKNGIKIDKINEISLAIVRSENVNDKISKVIKNDKTIKLNYCGVCEQQLTSDNYFVNHKKSEGHKEKVNEIFCDSVTRFLNQNNLGKPILFNRDDLVNFVRTFDVNIDCDYRREIPKDCFYKFKEILLCSLKYFHVFKMSISLSCTNYTITHEHPHVVRNENDINDIYEHLQTNLDDLISAGSDIELQRINKITLSVVKLEIESKPVENPIDKSNGKEYVKFKYRTRVPFSIYADVWLYNREVVESKIPVKQGIMCYGIYVRSHYPDLFESRYKEYYGEDAAKKFVRKIENLDKRFTQLLETNIELKMTKENEKAFKTSKNCYFCGKEFRILKVKVKDHDHYSGEYRGAAHRSCNLLARHNEFVPLYFYNGSRNDIQLVIKELLQSRYFKQDKKHRIIEFDKEFVSLKIGCIRILDASRFFSPNSLEDIESTLEEEDCKILRWYHLKYVKCVYPFDYVKTNGSFDEIDMKDYTMKHLQINVLMLADVFEKLRDTCLSAYEIDPCYCYSLPHLAWLAALKHTKVQLKYYKEGTYDELFAKGIKRGVSTVSGNREIVCNNKHTNQEFEKEKTQNISLEHYLLLLDANSLSSFAMMQELPTGEMGFCKNRNYEKTLDGNNKPGFVYVVDLEYPNELKDKTKDETKQDIIINIINKHYKSNEQLIMNQHNKKNIVIEGRMLDWYLDHGIKITKIHKKLKYKKSNWLKDFIEFNIGPRNDNKELNDKFCVKLFELMNNAFHERVTENVEFKNVPNSFGLCLENNLVEPNKFNYIGFTTLELSKLKIYQFIYDCIDYKNIDKWKSHDTDSIFREIFVPLDSTVENEVAKLKEFIHTTELGKFTDKLERDSFIKNAIFIKSKCHGYETTDSKSEI